MDKVGAFLGLGVVICFSLYNIYTALKHSRIRMKYLGSFDKKNKPCAFWFSFVFYSILGLTAITILIGVIVGLIP